MDAEWMAGNATRWECEENDGGRSKILDLFSIFNTPFANYNRVTRQQIFFWKAASSWIPIFIDPDLNLLCPIYSIVLKYNLQRLVNQTESVKISIKLA